MKARLYSTVSAVALFAVVGPAVADAGFSGVGQLYVGGGTAESTFFIGDFHGNPFFYGGKAQGYWTLSPDVHLQADLFAQHTDDVVESAGGFSTFTDSTRFGGALHLLHPFENRARLGIAGSVWSSDVGVQVLSGSFLGEGDATFGLVALEGQFFGDNWTLSGQAGVFTTFSCDGLALGCTGAIEDGTFVRGKIRYFLNDNTALNLEALQMWGGVNDDVFSGKTVRADTSIVTLDAEHRFRDSPFSAFLTLSHQSDELDSIISTTIDTQTVLIGVKFYLDQASLKTNDRTGAALDTPTFGNALEGSAAGSFPSGGP
jgi:hypothetical protein